MGKLKIGLENALSASVILEKEDMRYQRTTLNQQRLRMRNRLTKTTTMSLIVTTTQNKMNTQTMIMMKKKSKPQGRRSRSRGSKSLLDGTAGEFIVTTSKTILIPHMMTMMMKKRW